MSIDSSLPAPHHCDFALISLMTGCQTGWISTCCCCFSLKPLNLLFQLKASQLVLPPLTDLHWFCCCQLMITNFFFFWFLFQLLSQRWAPQIVEHSSGSEDRRKLWAYTHSIFYNIKNTFNTIKYYFFWAQGHQLLSALLHCWYSVPCCWYLTNYESVCDLSMFLRKLINPVILVVLQ